MTSFLMPIAIKEADELTLSEVSAFVERLKQDDVKEINICLVGVVGKFREGKSTLLNIMDRYLTMRASGIPSPDPHQYVFGPDKFVTSKETDGCTQGIWITANPYILKDIRGQQFAVFLLDTQGLFDFQNSTALDSALFLLTSMFSSFTIFNLMRILGKDQLDMLAEFSRLAQKIRSTIYSEDAHIFQDLVILVRDALLGKLDPGWESGAAYLDKSLNMQTKNAYILQEITKTYQQLRCFLMPRIANDPDDQDFSMTEEHILPDFIKHVNVLLSEMFGPKMLRPFQHKGAIYNCGSYAGFVEHITELFVGGKIPKAESMLEAMVRFELQVAVDTAFKYYRGEMSKITSRAVDPEKLKELHGIYKQNCKMISQNEVAILAREPVKAKPFLQKLDNIIEEEFLDIERLNDQRLLDEEAHREELDRRESESAQLREQNRQQVEENEQRMQQLATEMANFQANSEQERREMQEEFARQQRENEAEKQRLREQSEETKRQFDALQVEIAKNDAAAQQHLKDVADAADAASELQQQLNGAVENLRSWQAKVAQPLGFWESVGQAVSFGIFNARRLAAGEMQKAQENVESIKAKLNAANAKLKSVKDNS